MSSSFHLNQLSKESRQALTSGKGTGSKSVTLTDDYENLDRTSSSTNQYLNKKSSELDENLENFIKMTEAKHKENEALKTEILELERVVEQERIELTEAEIALKELNGSQRLTRAMKRTKLLKKIKDQHDIIMKLQDQLDVYMFKSFPCLG